MDLTLIENKARGLSANWNASSGSLENDAWYIEQFCNLFGVEEEPGYTLSERDKLSFIWKMLLGHNRTLTPARYVRIREKLKK